MKDKLKYILTPQNIAIIGASNNLRKSSGRIIVNLLKTNYAGDIYVVNPNHKVVLEFTSYCSILDIEVDIDLACIISPAETVPQIMKECVKKGVKAVIVLSGGFSENGLVGKKLEVELQQIIQDEDIVVYGPNSPGIFSYIEQWGISFSPRFEPKFFEAGNVGLISQGGTLARAILDANEKGVRFSYWFSPGNEIDIDLNDCLEFLIEDNSTEVILLVMESYFEEERFFNLVHQAFEKNKPIIVLSVGKTIETISALPKYAGKEAKNPFPWEVIQHPGIMLVNSVDEMVSLAWMFSHYDQTRGERTIIFSWSGGSSIYMADLCAKFQIHLPDLSNDLKEKLQHQIKIKDYFTNPLDITTTVYDDIEILTNSLRYVVHSDEFDYIVVIFPFHIDYINEVLARELIRSIKEHQEKVFIPVFLSQGYQAELSLELIQQQKVPYFLNEYTAMKALSMFIGYKKQRM